MHGPPDEFCVCCRNYRCDCGNSKFKDLKCKLCPDKRPSNEDNKYNHNFNGQYCTCSRPYPDPHDTVADEMIQCIMCEDWYHGRHLQGTVPAGADYEEMVCQGCMKTHDFLWAYKDSSTTTKMKSEETKEKIDVENAEQPENKTNSSDPALTEKSASSSHATSVEGCSKTEPSSSTAPGEETVGTRCLLAELKRLQGEPREGAAFWPSGWRSTLCKCSACKARYEAANINFLLDLEDTVLAYEERGKQRRGAGSHYDQGLQALSNMNRVQQVEVIHGYNDLKTELKDYLKKFAENGKIVREEDIREFFTGLEARKRQRGGGVQWTCK